MSLREIINSYDPTMPLAEASTIPADWYLHPEIAELERRTVFSKAWQVAGRIEQLLEPGSYVACTIASEPVIVVRGNDGLLRAFFNVCRHHAAVLMSDSSGHAAQLRCPYHAWTYSLEGELKNAPDLGAVCNFDRNAMGLVPVEVCTWNDWVFVRVERKAPPNLLEHMPEVTAGNLQWFERRHYHLACNWKIFVDNYLDGGYHVPHIHKGLDQILEYSEYQIENGGRSCLQWSPLEGGERALYYWIYPNFMINRYPEAMDTNLVIPTGINQTEVVFDFYFSDISGAARERNLARIAMSEAIQDEDVRICQSVQHGIASRAYERGRLSARREAGEHLFHRLLFADLKSGLG